MTTITVNDTRRFTVGTTSRQFIIREVNPVHRLLHEDELTRQQAWDRARCQKLPVTLVPLHGDRRNLGVVYDEAAEWAALKSQAAALEAEQERAAYEATSHGEAAHVQPTAFREGYFVLNGVFVKVMLNRARTRHYARVLDPATRRWEFDRGLMARWPEMRPLTPADAKAFGDLHHYCFNHGCGRELTKPESIERGVGPVCARKLGWL